MLRADDVPGGPRKGESMRMNHAGWMLALLAAALPATAGDAPLTRKDVAYAGVGTQVLALDLHMPAGVQRPPLVVYLHGGAWRDGDKSQYPQFLVASGFAVASLDFRSTNVARFPANVHDIKAGIRFLRAKALEYGYRADRIAVMGASSGGHLAALVGVTNGHAQLEGTEGAFARESSAVQAVVSYFGASNLETILSQSTPFGVEVRTPALRQLLGALPDQEPGPARLASPVNHVDRNDPPAMLLHGDQDRQMPVNQLHELEAAYRNAGLAAETLILHGVGHQGEPFFTGEPAARVVDFLHRALGR
jgi:acetyl esterase/lipase